MKTATDLFKKNIDKSFSQIELNSDTIKDAMKFKDSFKEEKLVGGNADKKNLSDLSKKNLKKNKEIEIQKKELKKQLDMGIKVEMEHTRDKSKAREIALDHLFEDPKYYDKLKKMENKEATSTGSSGQFSGPIAFADSEFLRNSLKEKPKKIESNEATSTSSSGQYSSPAFVAPNKKNWRGAQKPLYKGGQFVKIKRKCLTFPYCNQGDISSLKLKENSQLDIAIKKVSKKLGINESVIRNIIAEEIKKSQ